MRKLILQSHITLDGFVADPDGKTDWMFTSGGRDEESFKRVVELAERCDTLLMGRKMTRVFIDHWQKVVDVSGSPEQHLAQLIVNMRKIVFSKTITTIEGRNLEVENGDLVSTVNELKKQDGKDILVYGGANFVTSLITANLIDEYFLFVNPVAIGTGLTIFKEKKFLKLESSIAYKNGKVINKFLPA